MKKFILISAMAFICTAMFSACAGCSKAGEPPTPDEVTPAVVDGIVLENTVSTDRELMFVKYATNYDYYESQVTLRAPLNAEACDGTIEAVTNVFQFYDTTGEPQVILSHYKTGEAHSTPAPINDFYLGDNAINDEPIRITFRQAIERCRRANVILPDSRLCVLRKPVQPGGLDMNPQYIFGNYKRWVKVDAVTGEVTSGSDPG